MAHIDGETDIVSGTRERLLDAAEHLFARGGIAGVATREIVESAGQRNVSSISYHFGSRENLLVELLARRGGPVDFERGRLRDTFGKQPSVSELVSCLVVPQAELLGSEPGRSYIRIVAQLRGRFAYWRLESDVVSAKNLLGILDEIEQRATGSHALRRERVLSMIMLMTSSTAERARRIDEAADGSLELPHAHYVENLTSMCTAVVTV